MFHKTSHKFVNSGRKREVIELKLDLGIHTTTIQVKK